MASINRETEASISLAEIEAVLCYNPITGQFRRKDKPNAKVGTPNQFGRVRITVCGERFLASRLAWFMHYGEWPSDTIDHINGIRDDDRIANLRLASPSEQQCNRGMSERNTSGIKGVSHNKRRAAANLAPWEAYITLDSHRKHLGYFANIEDAAQARQIAEDELHGTFIRHEVFSMNNLSLEVC